MSLSLLLFGFLLGVKHALEADHVAAIAALATRAGSLSDHAALAGFWGVGHALTLTAVGTVVVLLGVALPPSLSLALEGAVGVALVVLGADVLRRLRRDRVHVHVHRHDGGRPHLHLHSHAGEAAGEHRHAHAHAPRWRALLIGTLHGLAGSAALVLLAVGETRSVADALAYLATFAAGSVAGMMSLSLAISIPLRLSVRHLGRLHSGLEGALGTATMALGLWITLRVLTTP
jgi:cytochrome c biogenesis protein CcdA